jgi:hypothetical protein
VKHGIVPSALLEQAPSKPQSWTVGRCIAEYRRQVRLRWGYGRLQVLLKREGLTVLQEVKRLEQRRVAGVRAQAQAQAFILDPFAALGPHAVDVIDESEFESARGVRTSRNVV